MSLNASLAAQIVASAPDAIITLDEAGTITSWNPAAEALYGWTHAQASGHYINELLSTAFHPPDNEQSAQAQLQYQGWWRGRVRQLKRDGFALLIHSSVSLLHDHEGRRLGMVVVNRDLTDYSTTSPARLDQIPSTLLGSALWEWNIQSDSVTFSSHIYALLDHPPESQIQLDQTILQAIHPDDYDRVTHELQAHFEQHQPFSVNLRLRTGANVYRWFLARGQAHRDAHGRPLSMRGSLTDIDEIRQARQNLEELNRTLEAHVATRTAELRQSLHFVESVTAATPDLLYIYDLAQRRYTYTNRSLLATLNYNSQQSESLSDRVLSELIHPDDANKLAAHMVRVADLPDGVIAEFTYRLLDAAGNWRWFYGRELVFQRDEHGRAEQILGIASDITLRKQTDEALRQTYNDLSAANAQLARANRLKDEFLANMSHELRTPLNAILGRAESLLEQIYGPLTPDQSHAITNIEESGRHLLELINDILDLSRIEADRIHFDLDMLNVDDLCAACIRLISPAADKQGLTLSLVIASDVPPIFTDARRLRQVLLNLLANAVKFTPSGGFVRLEVAWLAEQVQVVFSVYDSGIGIAAADMGQLFQPFVQIDSGLQRQFPGTGLGLALVARLIDRLGGSVSVTSEPGAGSCFSVYLATAEDADLWQRISSLEQPHEGGLRLLLADDYAPNLTWCESVFAGAGFLVRIAHDGDECLRAALAMRPDIMVVDLQMPRLSGVELIKRLRAVPALAGIPLVALTALDLAGDAERCRAAGASHYLRKPLAPQLLYELITRLPQL
jgi:PAS domain S-box-containing protein